MDSLFTEKKFIALLPVTHFFLIFILLGCHSRPQSNDHFNSSSLPDTVTASNKKYSKIETPAKYFDNQQPFKIISLSSSIDTNTTDNDTSKCTHWKLTEAEIENIIKHSEAIDGTTWDLSFLVLTCTKSVDVIQNGQQFKLEINAASFFSVNNGDTTLLFGDFNKSDRKYFITGPGK